MVRIKPSAGRARVEEGPRGLEITIPARRNPMIIVFFGFWLIGWGFGEVMVPLMFFGRRADTEFVAFVVAWLLLWTAGGLVVIYLWLWTLVGKERISLDGTTLALKREVLGYGLTREYELSHISNLRASPVSSFPWLFGAMFQTWLPWGGTIAFEYGAKTYHFGASLDEAEARILAQQILDRYKIRENGEEQ